MKEVKSNIQGQIEFDLSLFNFEGLWGYSSAGRAPALQAGGQRFDPAYLHQRFEKTEYRFAKMIRRADQDMGL